MHATTRLLPGWHMTFHTSIASEFCDEACNCRMPLFFICWSLPGKPVEYLTWNGLLLFQVFKEYWFWLKFYIFKTLFSFIHQQIFLKESFWIILAGCYKGTLIGNLAKISNTLFFNIFSQLYVQFQRNVENNYHHLKYCSSFQPGGCLQIYWNPWYLLGGILKCDFCLLHKESCLYLSYNMDTNKDYVKKF